MSRRWILGALMTALMLVMVSSVAYAAFVDCSQNNDTCTGTDQDDLIAGPDDPDLIYALGGSDVIRAVEGQDTVFGNTGEDQIHGGLGSDTLRGNEGNDYIRDSTRGNDVDRLFGGRHNDQLFSRDEDNLDTINCGPGFDRAWGYDAGARIAENCENVTQPARRINPTPTARWTNLAPLAPHKSPGYGPGPRVPRASPYTRGPPHHIKARPSPLVYRLLPGRVFVSP